MPATLPDTETDANVRDYVNRKLAAKKLLKVDLARAIGLSPSQLSRRINGHYPFSGDEIRWLARYFHVSADRIMNGHGAVSRPGTTP